MYIRYYFIAIALLLCSFAIPPELIHQFALKNQSGFGQSKSPVEVYIFSDWQTNANDQALIADIATQSIDQARVYFVDKSNQETKLISQINLGLLLYGSKDLQNYLQARAVLFKGANDVAINAADIKVAEEMFQSMFKNLHIERTPAVLVINLKDGRQQKFDDPKVLSAQVVAGAILALSK